MKHSAVNKIIETKLAKLSLDNDGIVWLTIDHQNNLTTDDIREFISAITNLSGGERTAVLVKFLNYKLPSREVRNYSADKEIGKILKAVAFLSTHPVARIGANFFIRLNKPGFPFQIFTKETDALSWLKKF